MVGKKGPFGGFCNYGIFGIWGKDPGTGKKKYKKVDAISEAAAVEKAAALGCVDPQSVEVIPFLPPSEKQQRYAAGLGVRLPEGCTVVDATALISRAEIGDDQVLQRRFACKIKTGPSVFYGRSCLKNPVFICS